ncbi:MAG: LysM peptidoglycan-binding domain-containing protein [Streptosporangiaceae bacterium]
MRSIELVFDAQEVSMVTDGHTRPRRAPSQTPLRLTRRGRAVVVASLVAAALAAFLLGAWQARASVGDDPPASGAPHSGHVVVVRPGQTLWEIAARHDPDGDPRVTVQRIIDFNGLRGAWVREGQRLRVPPQRG